MFSFPVKQSKYGTNHTVFTLLIAQTAIYLYNMLNRKQREEFSPWDDEPSNVLHLNLRPNAAYSSQKRYRTVERPQTHRSQMHICPLRSPRAIMNVNKVSFFTLDSELARALPPRQQSKGKFEGPRLTFYLKMNHTNSKSFQQARSTKSPSWGSAKQEERESLVSTNTSALEKTKQEQKEMPLMKSSANLYSIRKMRDDHRTMRKLKAVQLSRALRGK